MMHISKVRRKSRGGRSTQLAGQSYHHLIGHLRVEAAIGSDDSTQPNDNVMEDSNDSIEVPLNTELNVPSTGKQTRDVAKSTFFDRLRKIDKIPLTIKDGQRAPSCENDTIFTGQVT